MRGQQAVTLRADVAELQHQVPGQFAFDGEIVLSRILRAHLGLEITVQQDGAEGRPILRRTRFGSQDATERIRTDGTVLPNERRIQERRGQVCAASEGRLGAKLLEHQLLHRVIEKSPASADTGLAIGAEDLAQHTIGKVRAVGEADAGRKGLVIRLRKTGRNAGISGHHQSGGRDASVIAVWTRDTVIALEICNAGGAELAGIHGRVLPRTESLNMMQSIRQRRIQFPT